jgi:hypothetical protein
MMTVLRTIIGVVLIVAIGYFITNYSGMLQQQIGVKGASTDKAHEVSKQISNDVGQEVDAAKDKAMDVKVKDVVGFFNRFQKIPEDVNSARNYVQEQIDNVIKR